MTDLALLGPWLRRFLLEHLVGEPNVARNTQQTYRDTSRLRRDHALIVSGTKATRSPPRPRIAGVGNHAASFAKTDSRAGLFGYNRTFTTAEITSATKALKLPDRKLSQELRSGIDHGVDVQHGSGGEAHRSEYGVVLKLHHLAVRWLG